MNDNERYAYHFDEAVFEVPSGFVDESTQVLRWGSGDDAILLAVQRQATPLPLDEFVRTEFDLLKAQLLSYRVEHDDDEPGPPRFRRIAFRHIKDGKPLYHSHVYFEHENRKIAVSAIARAALRAEVDATIDIVVSSVRFRD